MSDASSRYSRGSANSLGGRTPPPAPPTNYVPDATLDATLKDWEFFEFTRVSDLSLEQPRETFLGYVQTALDKFTASQFPSAQTTGGGPSAQSQQPADWNDRVTAIRNRIPELIAHIQSADPNMALRGHMYGQLDSSAVANSNNGPELYFQARTDLDGPAFQCYLRSTGVYDPMAE